MCVHCLTFLSLMEYWRTGVVDALFVRIAELLSTALVDTFRCHNCYRICINECKMCDN